MNAPLNPGDLPLETGWCNLPNGACFVANRNVYKNITAEMIDWWFAWHPLEDLRYRIWANVCGDGIAAAYNAGAEMRNAEFANFYDVINKGTGVAPW